MIIYKVYNSINGKLYIGRWHPSYGKRHPEDSKTRKPKPEWLKKIINTVQFNRKKSPEEIMNIKIGALKYIYHAKNIDKEYWGIWDIGKFCKEKDLNYKVLRNYFMDTDKIEYKDWIITRENKKVFTSSFFSNYSCSFYPCHKIDQQNCLFCYCPIFWDCGSRDVVKCSECEFPHNPANYDLLMQGLENMYKRRSKQ